MASVGLRNVADDACDTLVLQRCKWVYDLQPTGRRIPVPGPPCVTSPSERTFRCGPCRTWSTVTRQVTDDPRTGAGALDELGLPAQPVARNLKQRAHRADRPGRARARRPLLRRAGPRGHHRRPARGLPWSCRPDRRRPGRERELLIARHSPGDHVRRAAASARCHVRRGAARPTATGSRWCCWASTSSTAASTTSPSTTSAAARDATAHLLGLGRRRIAAIGDQPYESGETAQLRTAGYRQALRPAGLTVDDGAIVATPHFHRADGAAAMERAARAARAARTPCSATTTCSPWAPCAP